MSLFDVLLSLLKYVKSYSNIALESWLLKTKMHENLLELRQVSVKLDAILIHNVQLVIYGNHLHLENNNNNYD